MAGCCCEEKALKLYKNYASRWDEVDWLSILFESEAIDLTGFKATFILGDFQKEWTDLTDGIIINLTDEETGALPVGLNYATLIVEDTSGNSKPFSTAIPVEVLTWVEGDQELDTYNMTVNALLDNETQMVIKIETAKVSLDWVLEKIAEHNASEEAHPYIQGRIDGKQDKLTSENAGVGISIEDVDGKVVISNTQTSAEWGNITGNIQDQLDLQEEFDTKQDTLIAGDNITIVDNVISSSGGISNLDGGSANSVYLNTQVIDGGDAEGV